MKTPAPISKAILGVVAAGALSFFQIACSGGSSSGPDAGETPMPRYPWDWVGVVGTGQSLSIGGLGTPILSTQPSANNLKLSLGGATVPPFDATLPALTMVPLTEPIRPPNPNYPTAYPDNIDGETPHTAMASQITAMVQAAASGHDYVTVHSVVGESGQPLTVIAKGATEVVNGATSMGRAYAATLFEAGAIRRLAAATSKTYGVGAIIITHGEADAGNLNYESDLFKLFSDYNADLPPLTGQDATAKIPMFVSQQNAVPSTMDSASASAQAQWHVGVTYPGDIVCIGPKYQYSYVPDASGPIHLGAPGYQRLGEKYGQVFFERVVLGHDWRPLQPTSAEISGKEITVHFHVPVPPLVWEDTYPPVHSMRNIEWAAGRGFEVRAANAPATIDAVEIVGPDAVKITCRNDLAGSVVVVGYATVSDGVPMAGGGTYRWGHLRDSDPFVGTVTKAPQPNYCVAFSLPVN